MADVKWQDEYYVQCYKLRREGVDNKADMARILGVTTETVNRWFVNKPAFKLAWDMAATDRAGGNNYREFILGRMPPRLQAKYAELEAMVDAPTSPKVMDEMFTFQGGEKMRQHLFLHHWSLSNFNASKACKFVGVSKATLDRWMEHDIDFAEMIKEIHFHKKNFLEGALMDLVAVGEPAAVVFANRQQNADRGYGKTVDVNITHSGTVQHAMLDMDKLDLPLDVKLQVLEAIRKSNGDAGVPGLPGTITPAPQAAVDVDFEIKDDDREAA